MYLYKYCITTSPPPPPPLGSQSVGMLIRLQGFDKGIFGGNFHTHNSLHLPPGLDVVCYSNGQVTPLLATSYIYFPSYIYIRCSRISTPSHPSSHPPSQPLLQDYVRGIRYCYRQIQTGRHGFNA